MRLIRDINRLQPLVGGCALAIGNFDGLHRGHQAVIEQLKARAATLGVPAAVMTFEPMPLEFFSPKQAPARLSVLREKAEDARALGVDLLVCVRFNHDFAALGADDFMQRLLCERLGVRHVIVGEDFHFAHNRAGNVARLRAFGAAHGFDVAPMAAVNVDGARVSSTRVRAALAAGDVALAKRLLGRAYRISGRVASGQQLGRQLGFPTANLRMRRRVAPCYGVYAARVRLADGREYKGAASLGVRPVVAGRDCLLEVYLLDFGGPGVDGNLYGQRIDVSFEAFVRLEADFDGLEALTRQMHEDVAAIRTFFDSQALPDSR